MYCNKCGKKIEENSKFCAECGTSQFDDNQTDSEFMAWRKSRLKSATIFCFIALIVCILLKSVPLIFLSAAGAIISLIKLSLLNDKR